MLFFLNGRFSFLAKMADFKNGQFGQGLKMNNFEKWHKTKTAQNGQFRQKMPVEKKGLFGIYFKVQYVFF